jgi:hypothetical protein
MALIGTINSSNDFGLKNRIINGAMVIDQRNAGASGTAINVYYVDRFYFGANQSLKATISQDTSVYPAGFNASLKVLSSSAYTPLVATDYFFIQQSIEGYNVADLGWGASGASTVTLSFWVRSSLTGTFGGAFRNSAGDRNYPFTYTISAANTWEQKTVTVAGDTTGTWLKTNGVGLSVVFGLGVGATFSGTAGAWSSTPFLSATSAVSVVGTNAATWYVTGVQLEKGSTATSFDYRPIGTELALCQRYYQKSFNLDTVPGTVSQNGFICLLTNNNTYGEVFQLRFPVAMRASPTATTYNPNTGATGSVRNITSGTNVAVNITGTAQNGFSNVDVSLPTGTVYIIHYTASAEL